MRNGSNVFDCMDFRRDWRAPAAFFLRICRIGLDASAGFWETPAPTMVSRWVDCGSKMFRSMSTLIVKSPLGQGLCAVAAAGLLALAGCANVDLRGDRFADNSSLRNREQAYYASGRFLRHL